MDEHDRRTGYGPAATKTSRLFAFSRLRARQEIRCTFCCWPPGPLARRERRAYPVRYVRSEQHRQRACGPQPGGARRRAGICFVAAPRRCTPASPASRRLASARPALAPKCTPYFLTGPKTQRREGSQGFLVAALLRQEAEHALFLARNSRVQSCRSRRVSGRALAPEAFLG